MPNKHACVINEKFYEFTLSDKKPALHISLSVNYNNEKKNKVRAELSEIKCNRSKSDGIVCSSDGLQSSRLRVVLLMTNSLPS